MAYFKESCAQLFQFLAVLKIFGINCSVNVRHPVKVIKNNNEAL